MSLSRQKIASIDIGTHTARLLIVESVDSPRLFNVLARKRSYIYLSEDFNKIAGGGIGPKAVERTISALRDFYTVTKEHNVEDIISVSTGVVRRAVNSRYFIDTIHDRTGIDVRLISGEEEAGLTAKGVLHSLDIRGPLVIFDLGGGTTEFIQMRNDIVDLRSLPLGAVELTRSFFQSDPPREDRISDLSAYVDRLLKETLPAEKNKTDHVNLVGSGGTVTTLAAMINKIEIKDITHDRLNGLILDLERIKDLFAAMRSVSFSERLRMPGLDRERARVILAGTAVVIRILDFFSAKDLTVSYSDILEGNVISFLRGEEI